LTSWHSFYAKEALGGVGRERRGLTSAEAKLRLARHGYNRLPPPPRRPAWLRFLLQFHNVLIYVMLAAAAIVAALGDWIDTAVLLSAVVVNACIGFVQEGKAEQALDAIRDMLSLRTTVLRDGRRLEIAAEGVVPGDIVVLASGDKVPADLRLVEAKSLRVSEAILTGESEAVDKAPAPVPESAPLGDRRCMLYSGTMVASGQAAGVVVATGSATEIGRIGTLLEQVQAVSTPLLRQMEGFGRWLALAIVLLAAATFVIGILWRGHPAGQMFIMVVALAASAIPEGLPAIMTITLALGVRRMAARKAIVRRLPAVEALGSVTVICSDKTGTLTRNEMTVQRVITASRVFEVSGVGYAPQGALQLGGAPVEPADYPELKEILRAAVLCNDAELHRREDEPDRHRVHVHLEGAATFLRLPLLAEQLDSIPQGMKVHVHLDRVLFVDHAVLDLLMTFQKQYEATGGRLFVDWEKLHAHFHGNGRTPRDVPVGATRPTALENEPVHTK
jgi:magnesium-transporting ATPase (P-type)